MVSFSLNVHGFAIWELNWSGSIRSRDINGGFSGYVIRLFWNGW